LREIITQRLAHPRDVMSRPYWAADSLYFLKYSRSYTSFSLRWYCTLIKRIAQQFEMQDEEHRLFS